MIKEKKTLKILAVLFCMSIAFSTLACSNQNINDKDLGIVMNETFYNPLRIESGLGDPWMYFHNGYYYYMHSEGTQITLTKSKWMTQIVKKSNDESVTKVIARQKAMNLVEIWAPEIFYFKGHWYIYFTATTDAGDTLTKDTNRRTYALKSKTDDAMGEWEPVVEIMLPMDYRSIDATFMDYNGHQYIIWSGWPNAQVSGWLQNLYITELKTDNPLEAKSLDDSQRVLISTPTYTWETNGAPQNEGPVAIFAPDGTPIIMYSASYSGADYYCIGYIKLTGNNPMETTSWTKHNKPLMQTDLEYSEVIAPGHNSVVKSPDGTEDWIVYHSAKKSGSGWDRMARLQKLNWNGNTPIVEKIARFSDPISLPSGEKVNRKRYEAESAEITDGCVIINSVGTDDEGNEFNYASQGKAVKLGTKNDKITFKVNVPENGDYLLSVRFSNTSVDSKEINVTVNGTLTKLFAPLTEYNDSFIINSFYTGLYLRPTGSNIIEISCDTNIYIDCIVVDYLERI